MLHEKRALKGMHLENNEDQVQKHDGKEQKPQKQLELEVHFHVLRYI